MESTNAVISKLVEYGWRQAKNIQIDLCNNTKIFVDKIIECIDTQKQQYQDQYIVFTNIDKKIKEENIEQYQMEIQEYSLHCLSIYMNNRNNKINKKNIDYRQKGDFDNELYTQLTIDNIGNIIQEMQKNGIKIKKEDLENYEIQKNIVIIDNYIKILVEPELNLKDDEKQNMIELLNKDQEYVLFFLQKLNNDRGNWGIMTNLNSYNIIGEIFKMVNDKILEKKDYNCFRFISILSMTYCRKEGDKLVYIYEFIKDHPYFKQISFWEDYLEVLIKCEIDSIKYIYNDHNDGNAEYYIKQKLSFSAFSNLLNVFNNMTDFGLEKSFIKEFLDKVNKKYSFSVEQINNLWSVYEEKINSKMHQKVISKK